MCAIYEHFEKIARNDKARRRIALVATARWLCEVMLSMLKSGECWRSEPAASGQARVQDEEKQ
jgi:hypothetical protein